ncbi:MAG: hypothetical protein WDN45_01150 [Caulobacteraceae bacterium]
MSVAFADGRPTVFYDSHSYDVMGRDLIEDRPRLARVQPQQVPRGHSAR